jgi:hypothetical protein
VHARADHDLNLVKRVRHDAVCQSRNYRIEKALVPSIENNDVPKFEMRARQSAGTIHWTIRRLNFAVALL